MAAFNNTNLNASITEQWDMDLEPARYAASAIVPAVTNKSGKVNKPTDTLNITIDVAQTAGTVDGSGNFTPATRTLTSVALVMNTWLYLANETLDQSEFQSWFDPKSVFPSLAGKALAVKYDTDLAALFANFTGAAIGTPDKTVTFGDNQIRAAMLNAAKANVPMENLTFVVPPVGIFNGVLAEGVFKNANMIGGGGKTPMITGNYEFPLLGVKFAMSNLLSGDGTSAGVGSTFLRGALLHKSALAIGMQINNRYRTYNRLSANVFADGIATESLVGYLTVRADHGFPIFISVT